MPTPTEPTLVTKDIKVFKITLTTERFEVKLPIHTEEGLKRRVIAFVKKIAAGAGPITQSLRGNIHLKDEKLHVLLKKDNKESAGEYFE